MSTELWVLIAGCTVITFAIKAVGPIFLGGRALPGWMEGVVKLLAPALLAALVVTQALANGKHLGIGADTAGVAAAGIALVRGAGIVTGVAIALVVTAGLRAL